MSDSFALSHAIPGTDIQVQIFNPGYGFKINRGNNKTLKEIAAMAPDSVHTVHMPSPVKANGEIIGIHIEIPALAFPKRLGDKFVTYMSHYYDGVVLGSGEALAVTSADCPIIVLHGLDKEGELHVIAAHAGRDSLLNKSLLSKGVTSPTLAESNRVIYNAVMNLSLKGVDIEVMHLNVYCGIRTGFCHPPNHDQYSVYNKALLDVCHNYRTRYDIVRNWDTGEVDMYRLISAQAVHIGIHPENVFFDDINTGNPDQSWASCRKPESRERGERNLVIVSRPMP